MRYGLGRALAVVFLLVPALASADDDAEKGKEKKDKTEKTDKTDKADKTEKAGGTKASGPGACGAKVLPIAVGNTWSYTNVPSPAASLPEVARITPAPPKSFVITVK